MQKVIIGRVYKQLLSNFRKIVISSARMILKTQLLIICSMQIICKHFKNPLDIFETNCVYRMCWISVKANAKMKLQKKHLIKQKLSFS